MGHFYVYVTSPGLGLRGGGSRMWSAQVLFALFSICHMSLVNSHSDCHIQPARAMLVIEHNVVCLLTG